MTRSQRTNTILAEVAEERARQVNVEGWSEAHDDGHGNGEMRRAAGCLCFQGQRAARIDDEHWPWDRKWLKRKGDTRRDLIKAAALIVAELERIDRDGAAND